VSTGTSEAGHSLTEVLISTALGGVILAGVFDLYTSSSNSILGQTNTVQMQTEAKAAMEFMAKELQLMNGPPTIGGNGDSITFLRVKDSGYSSAAPGSNTVSTLLDANKSWTPNVYAPTADAVYSIKIITGSGVGETYRLKGNTATTLTLADTDTWATIPDTTSLYFIYVNKTFVLSSGNTLRYQVENGPLRLLAANISELTFAANNTDSYALDITLVMQTGTKDPRTGQYSHYTLTQTVRRRN
jgi:Tfp pilus assembly protein PilW